MKTHIHDHLQLSLLGFTTLSIKLVSLGNIGLLHKAFQFINKLFIQSSVEVKEVIITTYLFNLNNFLIDCDNRKQVMAIFPLWMRTECLKMIKGPKMQAKELEFVLHLN
ncbi:MAG: hypothetical protein V4658_06465 [Bacteroidota bacterium]